MKLLVDLGNTRLKWATLDEDRLQAGGVFAHGERPLDVALRTEWMNLAQTDAVFVSSVVGASEEAILEACVQQRFELHANFPRSPALALGIRNAYAEPERLGIDRFLALAALHAQDPRVQVLVSVGTALTVDALDADGIHLGGLIVPSPRLMRESILDRTARVGTFDGHWSEIPDTTADAVVSGSLYAAVGAVERFCATTQQRLGVPPAVTLTGGGADELRPLLARAEHAHDLVLRGLALWATRPPARSSGSVAG